MATSIYLLFLHHLNILYAKNYLDNLIDMINDLEISHIYVQADEMV